jgi:hypothetical protein
MWSDLYEAHEAARALGSRDVANELRNRVKELVRRRHCDGKYTGKVDYKKNGARGKKEIWVKGTEDSMGDRIPLQGLEHLSPAWLSMAAIVDGATIDKFTVRLEGTTSDHRSWMTSIEMDSEPMGSGACGHPVIHCHVGPDHVAEPNVRVAMPALKPWDALDWLLSLVIPTWEPAPWASVKEQLATRDKKTKR